MDLVFARNGKKAHSQIPDLSTLPQETLDEGLRAICQNTYYKAAIHIEPLKYGSDYNKFINHALENQLCFMGAYLQAGADPRIVMDEPVYLSTDSEITSGLMRKAAKWGVAPLYEKYLYSEGYQEQNKFCNYDVDSIYEGGQLCIAKILKGYLEDVSDDIREDVMSRLLKTVTAKSAKNTYNEVEFLKEASAANYHLQVTLQVEQRRLEIINLFANAFPEPFCKAYKGVSSKSVFVKCYVMRDVLDILAARAPESLESQPDYVKGWLKAKGQTPYQYISGASKGEHDLHVKSAIHLHLSQSKTAPFALLDRFSDDAVRSAIMAVAIEMGFAHG